MCEGRQKSKFTEDEEPERRGKPSLNINIDKLNDSPISPTKARLNFNPEDTSPGGRPKNFLDINNFLPKDNVSKNKKKQK